MSANPGKLSTSGSTTAAGFRSVNAHTDLASELIALFAGMRPECFDNPSNPRIHAPKAPALSWGIILDAHRATPARSAAVLAMPR